MNKFTLGVALAALALPVAASAQQLPAAVVAIVDNERILTQCTACVAANAQLQAQQAQAQARAQALGGPLQTEEQAIRALVAAIPQGQQPDAALQQRIQTFQTQQANAQRELQTLQQTLGRNVAYVRQQIGERLQPIVSQVMQQRGANLAVDRAATLAHATTIEITDGVLAALNAALPSVNVTAPPPAQQPAQQQPQQPEGR